MLFTAIGLSAMILLMLTTIGVYALTSFAVAQRRREIGIRAALGADPRRLLASIVSRALGQLALGASPGGALAVLLNTATEGERFMPERGAELVIAVGILMIGIGMLAAVRPARRGLRIQPTEALRPG